MTSSDPMTRRRRWTTGTLFIARWVAVVMLAVLLIGLGVQWAGGAAAFRDWLGNIAPYALIGRLVADVVGAAFYIGWLRPRLRAMQRRHADGGAQAHARLVKVERMLVIVLIAIEVANLPGWIG